MTPYREFFFYLRNDYCYRENKKIGNFCRFFDEKKLNVAYVFFKKNMLTQTNAVQPGNNEEKLKFFLHCIFQKGSKKTFIIFGSKRLVPNLELRPFFV